MPGRLRAAAGWRLLLLAVPPLLAAGALAAAAIYRGAPEAAAAAPPPAAELPAPAVPGLLVDVSGAVVQPGLYRLHRGDRLYAAIAAAGGLAADADPAHLPDLAAALRDGQQVRVPALRGPARSGLAPALDLNAASEAELASVPGFTVELAHAAVVYRERFGGFLSARELVTELGMGESEFLQARRRVRT